MITSLLGIRCDGSFWIEVRRFLGPLSYSSLIHGTELILVSLNRHFVIVTGNVLLVTGSILGAAKDRGYNVIPAFRYEYLKISIIVRFTFALGTFFAYVTMVRYLEFAEKFYILIYTLRSCFGNVMRWCIWCFYADATDLLFLLHLSFLLMLFLEWSCTQSTLRM